MCHAYQLFDDTWALFDPRHTDHRERLRVRRDISALQEEGEQDYAWWDPNESPDLPVLCRV